MPAEGARGSAVLVHGLNRSRIEMIRKAPFLHAHGWNALLFDLRHHGDSGGATTTFGYREKEDVRAAVAFARSRSTRPWSCGECRWAPPPPSSPPPTIPPWPASSATAATGACATRCTTTWRLFRRFRWWLAVVPSWPVADEIVFWMGRRGGFDPEAVDIRAAAGRLQGRPALFVANSEDRRMPKEIAFELQKAAGEKAQVLIVPGKSHGGAWRDGTAAYEAAVVRGPRRGRRERPRDAPGRAMTRGTGRPLLPGPGEREPGELPVSEKDKPHHVPFPEDDNGDVQPQPTSYTMVDPRFRHHYFAFYKETYKPSVIDRKTKELIAIAASLATKCQGCLEGHIKKALKFGATRARRSRRRSRSPSASTPPRSWISPTSRPRT